MSTSLRSGMILLALSALLVSAVACGGKQRSRSGSAAATDTAATTPAATQAAPASVRFIHAVANAGAATLMAGETQLVSNLAALSWSQQRVDVPSGAHNVRAMVGGNAVANADLTFSAGGAYTVIVLGDASSRVRDTMPAVVQIRDNLSAPPSGQAHVRLLHALPGTGAVTLTDDAGGTFGSAVSYRAASRERAVPAGNRRMQARLNNNPVANIAMNLAEGRIFTFLLLQGASGPQLLAITDRAR